MRRTGTIIIGAGQSGLGLSYCLGRLGIEHVVLERGQVGERWRSERWDSLRLLTPNWMNRFPGWSYHGNDPDGSAHPGRRGDPHPLQDRLAGAEPGADHEAVRREGERTGP